MIARGVELFCTLYIGDGDILENCLFGSYSKNRRRTRLGGASDEGCKNDFESSAASCDSSTVGSGSACKYVIDRGELRNWTVDVLYLFLRYLYSSKAALESDLAACSHRRFLCSDILWRRMGYHYAGRCKRETNELCQSINSERWSLSAMAGSFLLDKKGRCEYGCNQTDCASYQ